MRRSRVCGLARCRRRTFYRISQRSVVWSSMWSSLCPSICRYDCRYDRHDSHDRRFDESGTHTGLLQNMTEHDLCASGLVTAHSTHVHKAKQTRATHNPLASQFIERPKYWNWSCRNASACALTRWSVWGLQPPRHFHHTTNDNTARSRCSLHLQLRHFSVRCQDACRSAGQGDGGVNLGRTSK